VGDINLPPVEPLTLGARIAVVVVVPPFAEGDDREEEAVLAVVARLEASLTEYMREGVDAECSVIEERCADAESPREHLKRTSAEFRVVRLKEVSEPRYPEPEKNRGNDVVSLKEAKFRELHEILYKLPPCFNELRAQYPTNMCPPHAVDAGWMYILFGIRELMVMAMV
jgi:hypothetical protein